MLCWADWLSGPPVACMCCTSRHAQVVLSACRQAGKAASLREHRALWQTSWVEGCCAQILLPPHSLHVDVRGAHAHLQAPAPGGGPCARRVARRSSAARTPRPVPDLRPPIRQARGNAAALLSLVWGP